jgi:hypothetical protein
MACGGIAIISDSIYMTDIQGSVCMQAGQLQVAADFDLLIRRSSTVHGLAMLLMTQSCISVAGAEVWSSMPSDIASAPVPCKFVNTVFFGKMIKQNICAKKLSLHQLSRKLLKRRRFQQRSAFHKISFK